MFDTPASGQERRGYPHQNTSEQYSPEDNDLRVLMVFETFASNNWRKRALRDLAEVCQVAAINPWNDTAITFNAEDEPKLHSVRAPAALVLNPIVDGFWLTKVLMDGGSGLNLMYEDTLNKMQMDRSRIEQSNTTFRGIIPSREARCAGKITLDVVFGTPENYRSEEITFQVAPFNSGYHALLGRDAFTRFQAIPHYGYMKLKMPGPNGIITLASDPDIALRAENKTASLALEALSEALAAEELTALRSMVYRDDIILDKCPKSTSFKPADEIVKFQVHPTDSKKTASIGRSWTRRSTPHYARSCGRTGTYSCGTLLICQESHADWPNTASIYWRDTSRSSKHCGAFPNPNDKLWGRN